MSRPWWSRNKVAVGEPVAESRNINVRELFNTNIYKFINLYFRGVAQWLSASALGAESRAFESLHSDN